jgi:hypothetical protein
VIAAVNELGIEDDGLVVFENQPGEPFGVSGRYSFVQIPQFRFSACNPEPRGRPPDSRRAEATSRRDFMEFLINLLDGYLAGNRVRL